MSRPIRLGDGSTLTLAVVDSDQLYVRGSRGDSYFVGNAEKGTPYALQSFDDGTLVVETPGRQAFISSDGGRLWTLAYDPDE